MAARKRSLRDLAAKSRKDGLAAANTGPVAGRIAELDPGLVHTGGLAGRLDVSQAEIATLAESLRNAGQKVPILVRPHPERPGEYEIVAGRRRLAACRLAGISVRAEIQDLDDTALVMGQAIENIAREDLTYIERAKLAARMVDEAGLDDKDIDTAFSCGKTDRSRYLKIGRGVPDDILSFVGKAPGIGRPRWEKLVAQMAADETALPRMREALAAANTEDGGVGDSDARFSYLYEAAFRSEPSSKPTEAKPPAGHEIWVSSHDKPVGTIKRTGSGVQLTLRDAPKPGFLDWLAENGELLVVQMLREYEAHRFVEDISDAVNDEQEDE
ncbi:putative chromosome-partitioning protein ParB [Pseudooceanicola marinus]|uniref:Putative chromosome-partitioning protein ParB n=2 Tax=Pseudooceanicola marinus TaxID=396013 RepID=A0A1X7A6I6_9RHOB|nr:plasmid partitioning protein RepB [Pseudooceanicola marinus]SLN71985.1 putative chromosome-partitioning protein ParB [Pseudooceanicola marinus]